MRRKLFILAILFVLISWTSSKAQSVQFSESSLNSGIYIIYNSTYLGEGVNFFDYDEDGWDDLTLCQTNGPVVLYRNLGGYFEPQYYFFPGQQAISSCWGDLDNNGKNDLVISTYDNGIHIYENVDNQNFNDVTMQSNIIEQDQEWYSGIALSDINRDGLLDISVANYNDQGKNLYLMNQGNLMFQTLMGDAPFLNVQKHAFQPGFIDLNKDLWPDVYMINDFYEGNEYYWNYGDLNLSENDTTLGLNIQADAMSNSWNDFDRDGDMDLYVTNRFVGNYFMKQIENLHFENIAELSGTNVPEWCWSATWMDPDNNGFTDLLITKNSTDIITDTSGNYLFMNQTDGNFILDNGTSHFPTNGFASAVGDFDNNGKCDIAMSTRQGYEFKLYQNTTNTSGNFFKFRLEGHFGNRNGIGTHYDIWTNNRRHYGYTQAGENYIAQNSQNRLIGIGDNGIVDSIILKWPSGIIDKYYNLQANQLHVLHEAQNLDWWAMSDTILCGNSDTIWMVTSPYTQAIWWDNTNGDSNFITQPGTYTFTLDSPFGSSKTFNVHVHEPAEYFEINTENNYCNFGESGSINIQNVFNNQEIYNASQLVNSIYPVQFEILGCTVDTNITISSNEIWNWDLPDTLWTCDTTSLDWNYWDDQSENELLDHLNGPTFGTYNTTWQNNQGCIRDTLIQVYSPIPPVLSTSSIFIPPTWNCQLTIDGIDGPYSTSGINWENDLFNIDNAGSYPFHVIDRWGCIYSDTLVIEPITSISSDQTEKGTWLFRNPYLKGPTAENVTIYNSIGQILTASRENEKWLLPYDSTPRWVYVNGVIYPVHWILDK